MTKLLKIGLPIIGLSAFAGYAWHQKKSVVLYGVAGAALFWLPIFLIGEKDKTAQHLNASGGGDYPKLSWNDANALAADIASSKAPSLTNIFSSDTVSPIYDLQQLKTKENYNFLSKVFSDRGDGNLYSYLTSFIDKVTVDSAIANLA
jgi:hypothetical protein